MIPPARPGSGRFAPGRAGATLAGSPDPPPPMTPTAALLAFTLAAAILTVTPGAVFIAFGLKLALERR